MDISPHTSVSGPELQGRMEDHVQLCWKCHGLLDPTCPDGVTREFRFGGRTPKSRTLETSDPIENTARQGCRLCLRLLSLMNPRMRAAFYTLTTAQDTSRVIYEHSIRADRTDKLTVFLYVFPDKSNEILDINGDEIKVFLDLIPAVELEPFMNPGPIEASTDSNSSWALIADWIDTCNRQHERCRLTLSRPRSLPRRLIDVGQVDPSSSTPPRLVLVNDETSPAPYATLSHCWGDHAPLRLLSSNMTSLQHEIPFSALSHSFRDAVKITRRLGLRYLWIDSLCIIQDSEQDWQEQSAAMAAIYSGSHCNIAASHARDGTEGCFSSRDPDLVVPLSLTVGWGTLRGTYRGVPNMFWRETVMETPLGNRAWVFQELLMAPRNLHFGAREVIWSCADRTACETFPRRPPPTISTASIKGLDDAAAYGWRIRAQRGLGAAPSSPEIDTLALWGALVQSFSHGRLTVPTDKLVALSAVASQLAQHIGPSEYLAGLWRRHLPEQLLWEVRGIQWRVARARPPVYVAPSWSWASTIGHVECVCDIYNGDGSDIVVEILDARVDLVSTANPFGQVRSGALRLRGSLAMEGVCVQVTREFINLLVDGQYSGTVILDDGESTQPDEVETHDAFYYLPIRFIPEFREIVMFGETMSVPEVSGIILEPTSPNRDVFRRVGKFEVHGRQSQFRAACRRFAAAGDDPELGWGPTTELTII